jgi:hypothetical protein
MMPAGIEIMMAMEKPKAMTTNITLIFLLETFLNALVKTPKCFTLTNVQCSTQKEGNGKQLVLPSFHSNGDQRSVVLSLVAIS